jgi:hypothetical protein
METYYDSEEWGEIVYEESTSNRNLRAAPIKTKGATFIFAGIFDFILVGGIYYMATSGVYELAVPAIFFQVLFAIMIISGILAFVAGAYYLAVKPKKVIVLEHGLVIGKFKHYDTMPVIEIRGPKDRLVVLRRKGAGPAHADLKDVRKTKSYAQVLEAPHEYDFGEFKDHLRKLGYNGGSDEAKEKPKDEHKPDADAERPKDDKDGGGDEPPKD